MAHSDILSQPDRGLGLDRPQTEALLALFSQCDDLREFGREVIQSVVNALMDSQAQEACGAPRGSRSPERVNSRNGYRERSLSTSLGDLELRVPKLREGTYFPEGILERYTRVEASMVALVREMYVAGVSTRKVGLVAEELGVSSLSSSEVSALCAGLDEEAEAFRTRPIEGEHPYVWLDATYMKCRTGGRYASVALVTAIGMSSSGHKEFLGCACFDSESDAAWSEVLGSLRDRGLRAVRLAVSDAHAGLVAEELGVSSLSSSEVSALCAGLDEEAEAFRTRPIEGEHPYVWLDATYMKCRTGGRYASVALVTAIGMSSSGHKEFLGCACFDSESEAAWSEFLGSLRDRGLRGVRLAVSDAHAGLVAAVSRVLPGCSWQRCLTHLQRDIRGHIHSLAGQALAADLVRACAGQPDADVARAAWDLAAPRVRALSRSAGDVFEGAREDALAFMSFPREHWQKIRTNNVQERANREIKRRYRSVQSFPSEASMMRLVCAVLAGEEGRWAAHRVASPESAARASAPAPAPEPLEGERLEAVRLAAHEVIREVLDCHGVAE